MEWLTNSPEELWKYRGVIVAKVRLIELLKESGISVTPKNTGLFTHQIRCPFHKGKNGGVEKTPSFFISDNTNTYHCFACCAGGTVIDFVSQMDGVPPVVALEKLAKRLGIIDKNGKWDELLLNTIDVSELETRETIESHLFEISQMIREHIKSFVGMDDFQKELRWVEKVGAKVDDFLTQISHEDCECAEELVKKVKASIKKRKSI